MPRLGDIGRQYFDSNGDPLAGGKLYFYESGTSSPVTTFSDEDLQIPNTNPVILTADGRQPEIFFVGVVKIVLTDANDVQIEERDPIKDCCTDFNRPTVITTDAATRTISESDETCLIRFTNPNGITVTLPSESEDPLPVGFITHLHQRGAGNITCVAGSGALVVASRSLTTANQFSAFSCFKVTPNEWVVVGDQE